MSNPTMTARFVLAGRAREPLYIVSGPDGHEDLLARTTEAHALRDGLAYFLATRELRDGRWVLR